MPSKLEIEQQFDPAIEDENARNIRLVWDDYATSGSTEIIRKIRVIGRMWDEFIQVLPHLKPNTHVADLGTGDGFVSWHVLQQDPTITCDAFDICEGFLQLAQDKLATIPNAHHRIRLFQTDLKKGIPSPDESYDMVFANFFTQYMTLKEQQNLFTEVARIMKPDSSIFQMNTLLQGTEFRYIAGYAMQVETNQELLTQFRSNLGIAQRLDVLARQQMIQNPSYDDVIAMLNTAGFTDINVVGTYRLPEVPELPDPYGVIVQARKQ